MKKSLTLSILLAVFTLLSFANSGFHTDVYKVDTKKSSLEWYAQKVTGKHNGTIMFSNGELKDNHGQLSGSFEVDMKTIQNKDIESVKSKEKLETHLKSADFFDVEKFPVSKFVITSITPVGTSKDSMATHTVKGMLTIKDKTNEVSFDANMNFSETSVTCIGSATIDRSKFDIRYGSKTFFPDIGDKMISDEFILKFNVIADK